MLYLFNLKGNVKETREKCKRGKFFLTGLTQTDTTNHYFLFKNEFSD